MSTPHPKLFILSAAPVHHRSGNCWPRALHALPYRFTSSSPHQLSLPSKIHSLFHYLSLDLLLLHALSVSLLILVCFITPPSSLDSPKFMDLPSSLYPDRPQIFFFFSLFFPFFFLVLGFSPFLQHSCWLRLQHVCRLLLLFLWSLPLMISWQTRWDTRNNAVCVYSLWYMCVCVCTSQKSWHGSYIMAGACLITSGGAQWLIVGSSFLAVVLTLGHRASVLPYTHIVKVLLQCTPITLRSSYTHQHMHQIPSLPSSHLTPYPLLFLHLNSFASLALFWLLFYLNPSPPHFALTCSTAIYLVLTCLHSVLPFFKPFCAIQSFRITKALLFWSYRL